MRDGGLSTLCRSSGLTCNGRVRKTFPCPGYIHLKDGAVRLWHPLVNLYIWLTISSCYGSIPLALVLIVRAGGWSTLCHVSWNWLSPLHGWAILFITSIGKFVYMADHFLLLRLNPFGVWVDSERWCFEHSLSYFQVFLSAEDVKNICWPWLSPLGRWGILTMTSIGKFLSMAHHFILLWFKPLGLWVDSEGWWFGHSMS